ncbi:hypothetical protein D3C87_1876410 [compost metagenome]
MAFAEHGARMGYETRPDADCGAVAIGRLCLGAKRVDLFLRAVVVQIGEIEKGKGDSGRLPAGMAIHFASSAGNQLPAIISLSMAARRAPPTGAISLVSSWLSSFPVMPAP